MDYDEQVKRYANYLRLRKKGYTFGEIGKLYGITRQAVEQRVSKGKPKQSELLGGVLARNGFSKLEGRERTRMLVRLRDDFTCQDCGLVKTSFKVETHNKKVKGLIGRIKNLDVHHVNGECGKKTKGYDSKDHVSGLITLCHKCHFNRHDHQQRIRGIYNGVRSPAMKLWRN